jgi:AbrB family transcriptional regulator (stage V sporulation protein T)
MKATGIVRRIDELGRIVIPKEIRRTFRLREGDPLEIYTERGELILKKYSPMNEIAEYAAALADAIAENIDADILISDADIFIAASSKVRKDYIETAISIELDGIIAKREAYDATGKAAIPLRKGGPTDFGGQLILPVTSGGDIFGAVIILSDKPLTAQETAIAKITEGYLSRQLA